MNSEDEDKLDMSLDEIIHLELQKQNLEYEKWQRRKRLNYKRFYRNRCHPLPGREAKSNYARFKLFNQRRQHPLALYTRKYINKRIQLAKYTLLQQHARKRNKAYELWERRSEMCSEEHYSKSNDWNAAPTKYSFNSENTNTTWPFLQNTDKWSNGKINLNVIPYNLTIQIRNNLAIRSGLHQQRITPNFDYHQSSVPQKVQKTLNERFSLLQRFT